MISTEQKKCEKTIRGKKVKETKGEKGIFKKKKKGQRERSGRAGRGDGKEITDGMGYYQQKKKEITQNYTVLFALCKLTSQTTATKNRFFVLLLLRLLAPYVNKAVLN